MARTITDDHILEAALHVLATKGYAGATTREISAAAEINEVTLFRRFGNKKNLLMAAVEQEVENFQAGKIEYTGDLEGDLRRIVQFYYDLMRKRGHVLSMLMSEVPRQPELAEVMQTPMTIVQKITRIIERYQNEGALEKESPVDAFVSLVGPLFLGGIINFLQPQTLQSSLEPDEMVRRYLNGRATK
ncbi:MAG: TetR/AcrR family transcriptional regulator [Ardenticatenaceae bacterium]|nr:TetR/AcrR family transcriptional regulator [Ardenticatenaceae bacterium]